MTKLELVKVETDTTKVYSPNDSFVFKLTFNNQSYLGEDVESEVVYFGDAHSDNHDQKICHNVIGPLEVGKLCFELETTAIGLTKIPIKTLSGLKTILEVGKFRGEQFIRVGYVVDVAYPSIKSEKLIEDDMMAVEEDEEDAEEGDEEDDENEEEGDDEDEIDLMDGDELDEEYDEEEDGASNLENALAEAFMPGGNVKKYS